MGLDGETMRHLWDRLTDSGARAEARQDSGSLVPGFCPRTPLKQEFLQFHLS